MLPVLSTPTTIELVFAALGLLVCVLLLLRLVLGARRRRRLDAALQGAGRSLRERAAALWHWRGRRRQEARAVAEAARLAEAAIRRARLSAEREGNVIRPKAFRRERDEPRKPH